MPKDEPAAGQKDGGDDTTDAAPPRKRRGPPPALFVLIAVFAVAGYFGYQEFQERLIALHEEDARIQADMITVSSRVAGWVTEVAVEEGQAIEQGTALVVIDDREARAITDELTAQLEGVGAEKQRLEAQQELVRKQTDSRLAAERSELSAAQVTVSSLNPQLELAKREVERTRQLFQQKVSSRRQLDQAVNQLQQVEREHEIALAKLAGARARVKQAEAEQAQLDVLAGDLAVLVKREAEIRAKIKRPKTMEGFEIGG
ncbi:MAG: biotin/lipoyl-binding protein, partial [Rhodospirillaceae bacterium]